MIRVIFCGGGSVGHIAPSLAVREALQKTDITTRSLFICSGKKSDRDFLQKNKAPFACIHAPRLAAGLSLLLLPITLPFSLLESLVILLSFRPHVIFAKGGHVSVPPALIGALLRIPIVIHESDSSLGNANRFLLRFASHLCIGAPQKELTDPALIHAHIPITATGNPLREAVLQGSKDAGTHLTGFSGKRPVVMIWGGSQGAAVFNEFVTRHIATLLDIADVIHITGAGKSGAPIAHAHYWKRSFVYEELPDLLALADIVISRAGAGSIAELSAAGKASILIPLPGLAHDHQEDNAKFLSASHAVIVISQHAMNDELLPVTQRLIANPDERTTLQERLRTFAHPHAAQTIANILMETLRK